MPEIKKSRIIAALIVAVLLIGGIYLYFNLGGMIVRTAERIASNALGVPVDIGDIDVSLSDKKVIVSDLKIGNPPGYRKNYAMTADSILIGFNNASRELIDFDDITVKGSVVNLEVNEHGMNLIDLKNLANSKKQKESAGSEQVRVIIRHMVIEASEINPTITILDRDIAPIQMPAVRFSNLGGSNSGSNAGEVIVQVLTKYLTSAQDAARQSGMFSGITVPGMNDVKKTLDDAKEGLKSLFK